MNAAVRVPSQASIATILVYEDPALLRKNRIVEKLEERGLRVVRSYETKGAQPAPESVAEVGCLIIQGACYAGPLSRWKRLADVIGARFFRVPHQTSGAEWRALEEWISRSIVSPAPVSPAPVSLDSGALHWKARAEELSNEAAQARAQATRLSADLQEMQIHLETAQREINALRKRESLQETDTANLVKERDALREQLSTLEERASKIHKALQDKAVSLERANAQLKQIVETLTTGQEKLREERDQAIKAARDAKAKAAPAVPPWLPLLSESAIAYAQKLDGLVAEDILTPDEALAKFRAKHGGA